MMNATTTAGAALRWTHSLRTCGVAVCLVAAALAGCASPAIPEGYSGPLANIRDSTLSDSPNRAEFFYLAQIDGKTVNNVLVTTRQQNYGKGFQVTPAYFERDLPARAATLKLLADVEYGAPIQQLLNSSTTYHAETTIQFAPQPNKHYVVKGILTADKQQVWLEDAETGQHVQ